MSDFLGGSTNVVDPAPQKVRGLRDSFIDYLMTPSTGAPNPMRTASSGQAGFAGAVNNKGGLNVGDYYRQAQVAPPPGVRSGFGPFDSQVSSQTRPFTGDPANVATSAPPGDLMSQMAGKLQMSPNSQRVPVGGSGGVRAFDSVANAGTGQTVPGGNVPMIPGATQPYGPDPKLGPQQVPPGMQPMNLPNTMLPGAGSGGPSPFDRIFAQLPPDMRRVILGNPAYIQPMMQAAMNLPDFQRGQIRDVGAGNISATQTQSIDQLGGVNSSFFQNMMQQLSPAFAQRRAEAVAAAKEAAGDITGSGYANFIGSALNRSLGDEQARLADYAAQGVGMESQRQLQQAGLDLGASQSNQGTQLAASQANQGADMGFLGLLLNRAGLDLDTQRFNIGNEFQRQATNAGQFNDFLRQQAGLDQQRNLAQYGMAGNFAQQNAQNYLNSILGLSGAQGQVTQSGGAAAMLPGLISILPFLL